jgi:hypothetical protein
MVDQTLLSEFVAFVDSCDFPCSKDDLLDKAEMEYASDDIYDFLETLPDRDFISEADVIESIHI